MARKKTYKQRRHKGFIDPYYDTPEWRELRGRCLQRDKGICQYCGSRAHQADHVIPRSKGGADHLDNLLACCAPCNKAAASSCFPSVAQKRQFILSTRKIVKLVDPIVIPDHRKRKAARLERKPRPLSPLRQKLAERRSP